MKTYGIVSNFDELCGNAAYSTSIEKTLSEKYNLFRLDVTNINQAYKRKNEKDIINRVIQESKKCDIVNIQVEFGLYGSNFIKGYKNVREIIKNVQPKDSLSVTFHRIFHRPRSNDNHLFKKTLTFRLISLIKGVTANVTTKYLNYKYLNLIKIARKRNAKIIVHTKRDMKYLELTTGNINNVTYHPIYFDKSLIKTDGLDMTKYSTAFNQLSPDRPTVGVFGFISSYKNIEIVIQSCRDANANLVIFGQLHPSQRYNNPYLTGEGRTYLQKLNSLADGETIKKGFSKIVPDFEKAVDKVIKVTERNKDDKKDKFNIRYVSGLSDIEFIQAMKLVDLVVVPYWETGQSGSGIVSLAIQSSVRVILSDTESFSEITSEVDEWIPLFDPSNRKHLSNLINNYKSIPKTSGFKSYDKSTFIAAYS